MCGDHDDDKPAGSVRVELVDSGSSIDVRVLGGYQVTTNPASAKADTAVAELMAKYEADPALYKKAFMTGFTQVTSLGTYYDGFAYFYDENPFVVRKWYQEEQAQLLAQQQ